MGKLIVIEGTDGSGKSTQFQKLIQRLTQENRAFHKLIFPQYQQPSSALIRMYLAGDFGRSPSDVNAYAASTFFAVDRYASYKQDWGGWYQAGGLVISDRYTTSNAVHQTSKMEDPSQRQAFLQWLSDFEYQKLGLPQPDLVLFLDVPIDFTAQLLHHRQAVTHTQADIHEQDTAYLQRCRQAGQQAAAFYHWQVIPCVRDGQMRSIADIHEEIYRHVAKCLED